MITKQSSQNYDNELNEEMENAGGNTHNCSQQILIYTKENAKFGG